MADIELIAAVAAVVVEIAKIKRKQSQKKKRIWVRVDKKKEMNLVRLLRGNLP